MANGNWLSTFLTGALPLAGVALGSFLTWCFNQRTWDRQKQWEMKRDAVFEVMRILGELDNALLDLAHWYFVLSTRADLSATAMIEKNKAKELWNSNMARFDSARLLVEMIVGKSLSAALSECTKEMHSIAKKVEGGDTTSYTNSRAAFTQKVDAIIISARRALNVKNVS